MIAAAFDGLLLQPHRRRPAEDHKAAGRLSSLLPVKFQIGVRVAVVALAAATLAACASSSVVSNKSGFRQTSVARAYMAKRRLLAHAKRPVGNYGVASFYDDTETANGEKFDPQALTAAHPSLPFGTMLKVTNLETGRSVTVRINDRGPFKQGRIVDLSPSAAEKLGMVEQGLAKVRLDVVR
jgi:rare lipoprotein A